MNQPVGAGLVPARLPNSNAPRDEGGQGQALPLQSRSGNQRQSRSGKQQRAPIDAAVFSLAPCRRKCRGRACPCPLFPRCALPLHKNGHPPSSTWRRHYPQLFPMTLCTRTLTRWSILATEDRPPVVRPAIVTAEAPFPTTLEVLDVLFDANCARRAARSVVPATHGMTRCTIPLHIAHMRVVSEPRSVGEAAIVALRHALYSLRVAHDTAALCLRFHITTRWSVTGVALGM
jgi:hypothetical protein